jgi:16S rRNA (cytosine1402-N4)-methyltransferase
MLTPSSPSNAPHKPVLLAEVLRVLAPADGEIHVDGTFGAGGYSRAILERADCRVIAFDRDPQAIAAGQVAMTEFGDRLSLVEGRFGSMRDELAALGISRVNGIVLDIGVSSMQIDDAARGFSFLRDGPLDMRMSGSGVSAADVVNTYGVMELADIIFQFGEEKRSRRIARAIVEKRESALLRTTFDLVRAIEQATGPHRAHERVHPATRTFQALRIFVNAELEELADALNAAEVLLAEEGRLIVVTFHSLEDRIVKRFLAARSGRTPSASRHAPQISAIRQPSFELLMKSHMEATEAEIAANPRARSAKLRAARRTAAEPWPRSLDDLGLPGLSRSRH